MQKSKFELSIVGGDANNSIKSSTYILIIFSGLLNSADNARNNRYGKYKNNTRYNIAYIFFDSRDTPYQVASHEKHGYP